ncbi:MAG TPA: hypothetical protein VD994_03510 [Prosthecobacter sp.]|nr:hypothetical protein [Prosthecobacter sp.]
MRRLIPLLLIVLLTGCTQWKKLIGVDDDSDPASCGQVVPLDLTLTDAATMDALYPDQRKFLDNTYQFYDVRFLDYVQDLYDGSHTFPAGGLACMNEAQFRRAAEASVALNRLDITL